MLITRTVTKKILETIVHETFSNSNFGVLHSSSLLDSLKLLGFHYATNAGISINIEDLKTPDVKKEFIQVANREINEVSKQWQQGFVSDTERFQSIIDSWNFATESLKNRIVDYYQVFDPANNLYIMAFSGARGNMSQVRQLVGMRGLMSDQEGKIIDLPIQANFREGLTSIDYIISSYGARKGIVDTALKTADSGYLTRRLIYIAQDLIIREIDCKTKNGVLIFLKKKTDVKNIVGRSLLNARHFDYPYNKTDIDNWDNKNRTLTLPMLKILKLNAPLLLNVRSSLTCQSNGSICQKCYGWDLAQEKLISLGEAVGTIAAQSIGEPGTQLTMRTFHTGGIFTSELLKQIVAPFSGKLLLPISLKTLSYRTTHGTVVLKLQQEATLTIVNWQGLKKDVWLDIGSYLYFSQSSFVKEGQLLAQYSTQSSVPGTRRLKPIYTSLAGEIRFENLLIRKMLRDKRTVKVNQDDGVLWIASGKIFPLPKEINYTFPKSLEKGKAFATLKLVSPYEGIVLIKDGVLTIKTKETDFSLDLCQLTKKVKNCSMEIVPLVQNYQYIDKYTLLSVVELFPTYEGLIYSVRKKESKYISTLFIITEADVWKVNSDQVNDFSFFQDKKAIVRSGNSINTTSTFSRSGFFLKKDGFKMIFQNATPIFLSRGTILNYKQGDFVLEKKIFATLVNYTQQTEDIVQGLPKIEELVEARRPKVKAELSRRPGIILTSVFSSQVLNTVLSSSVIRCISTNTAVDDDDEDDEFSKRKAKVKKQKVAIGHSIYLKNSIVVYKNNVYKATQVPTNFEPIIYVKKVTKRGVKMEIITSDFLFQDIDMQLQENQHFPKAKEKAKSKVKKVKEKETVCTLLIESKLKFSIWNPVDSVLSNLEDQILYHYQEKQLHPWTSIKTNGLKTIFQNSRKDYIVYTSDFNFIFLEPLNPTLNYEISLASKLLFKSGSFVDIGEPISEGIVDIHDLLTILFNYHSTLDGVMLGALRALYKFQLLLVNSVQSIYQSQGVSISSKHIEIIVRQMTSKVLVKESGDTPFLPGEIIRLSLMTEVYKTLKKSSSTKMKYKTPSYEPVVMSATNSSLNKDGFLSAAGFQETKRVLTRAALEGSSDWLRGLKECIIVGRLIPAGSSFLNYKSYLDNVYSFKER